RYVSTHTISWALLAVDSVFPVLAEAVRATVTTPAGAVQPITTAPGENRVGGFLGSDVRGAFSVSHYSPNHHLFCYLAYPGSPRRLHAASGSAGPAAPERLEPTPRRAPDVPR